MIKNYFVTLWIFGAPGAVAFFVTGLSNVRSKKILMIPTSVSILMLWLINFLIGIENGGHQTRHKLIFLTIATGFLIYHFLSYWLGRVVFRIYLSVLSWFGGGDSQSLDSDEADGVGNNA